MIICIDCYSYCKPSNHLRNLRSIHRISENFISHWPPLHPMILQNYGNLFMIVMANNYPLTNVYKKLWKINENHHILWVKWPFSIAFCTLTRGYSRFTLVKPSGKSTRILWYSRFNTSFGSRGFCMFTRGYYPISH